MDEQSFATNAFCSALTRPVRAVCAHGCAYRCVYIRHDAHECGFIAEIRRNSLDSLARSYGNYKRVVIFELSIKSAEQLFKTVRLDCNNYLAAPAHKLFKA